MRILIDTHIWLWALAVLERISTHKRDELETLANTIYARLISSAETMIKASLGKLQANFHPLEMMEELVFFIFRVPRSRCSTPS